MIYEGLRIRAPATGLYPKTVPEPGETVLGYFLPAGTAIGMNVPALLKSRDVFGHDVDIFRPERFLETDESTRIQMERQVELAFGHGRYGCVGKSIALMELNKVFFEVRHLTDCWCI